MLNVSIYYVSLITLILLITGCGQREVKLVGDQTKAFDNAPIEVKQIWDKALASDNANDYVNANGLLESLSYMVLNEQQRLALDDERAIFGQHLIQAADKNDPAAIQVIQTLKRGKSH